MGPFDAKGKHEALPSEQNLNLSLDDRVIWQFLYSLIKSSCLVSKCQLVGKQLKCDLASVSQFEVEAEPRHWVWRKEKENRNIARKKKKTQTSRRRGGGRQAFPGSGLSGFHLRLLNSLVLSVT